MSQATFRIPGVVGLSPEELAWSAAPADPPSREATLPTGAAAFTGVSREEVYRQAASRRGEGAWRIDQKKASLCGPACLMHITAKRHGAEYFQFVTRLFETGDATLGRLRIRPGADCRAHRPGDKIDAADWVALAGIRDSENGVFDYDDWSDAVAGITLPGELAGWLERAGYTEVVNETNLYLCKSEANFREALSFHGKGFEVCLFINADVLKGPVAGRGAFAQLITTANHWVVLRKVERTMSNDVKLDVYTWGQFEHRVPERGTMSMSDWLQNYYGFVACKV